MSYPLRQLISWVVALGLPLAFFVMASKDVSHGGIWGLCGVLFLLAAFIVAHRVMRWLPASPETATVADPPQGTNEK